jgi:hypothetical protein
MSLDNLANLCQCTVDMCIPQQALPQLIERHDRFCGVACSLATAHRVCAQRKIDVVSCFVWDVELIRVCSICPTHRPERPELQGPCRRSSI